MRTQVWAFCEKAAHYAKGHQHQAKHKCAINATTCEALVSLGHAWSWVATLSNNLLRRHSKVKDTLDGWTQKRSMFLQGSNDL